MPEAPLLRRLKDRKIVQWGLAYLAAAWVFVEATSLVAQQFSWSPMVGRAVTILAASGFLVVLVIAWYHGEKGRQRVSGPELLILALLLVISGAILATVAGPDPDSSPSPPLAGRENNGGGPSVAVLPCENRSSDPSDEFLAASLHDEILLKLQSIPSLFSVGRASVEWYAGNPAPLRQVAEELGVGFVGECSVQKYENQIRLIFQLQDGRTGEQVWGDHFDRDITLGNLFDIQSEIAQRVAEALGAELRPEEEAQLEAHPTEDLEAYRLYLQGRQALWVSELESDARRAIALLQRAIASDSTFALAYAALGTAHGRMWWYHFDHTPERIEMARSAVEEARRLDPTHPRTLESMGWYLYWCQLDYADAAQAFSDALAKEPGNSLAALGLASVRRRQGRWQEAWDLFRAAFNLDPRYSVLVNNLAETLQMLREYPEALQVYSQGMRIAPDRFLFYEEAALTAVAWDGSVDRARESQAAAEALGLVNPRLDFTWAWLDVMERDFGTALSRIGTFPWEAHERQQFSYVPRNLWIARVLSFSHQPDEARVHYDSARVVLEELLQRYPEDSRYHSSLGIALAGLGRAGAAVQAGARGVELMPLETDAWRGTYRLLDQAEILTMIGDHEGAIDLLQSLLAIPSPLSVALLRVDPTWDPLREEPRFRAMAQGN